MNVASLELCKELYKLSRWTLTEKHWYKGQPIYNAPYGWDCSAYDLGFLLQELPQNSWVGYTDTSGQRGYALARTYAWNEKGDDINKIAECRADTPEDAACKLAIELFKQGVLKKGEIKGLLTTRIDQDEPGHLQDALNYLGHSLRDDDKSQSEPKVIVGRDGVTIISQLSPTITHNQFISKETLNEILLKFLHFEALP